MPLLPRPRSFAAVAGEIERLTRVVKEKGQQQ